MIPIILSVRHLQSHRHKTRGLIGADPVYPVYFTTHFGIHTFGLLAPIDVVILDKDLSVVTLKKNLPPDQLFFWNPRYHHVVELPSGTVADRRIEVGSVLKFKFVTT